jgi:hypothetical protein
MMGELAFSLISRGNTVTLIFTLECGVVCKGNRKRLSKFMNN